MVDSDPGSTSGLLIFLHLYINLELLTVNVVHKMGLSSTLLSEESPFIYQLIYQ